jgi:hypothetical protein
MKSRIATSAELSANILLNFAAGHCLNPDRPQSDEK